MESGDQLHVSDDPFFAEVRRRHPDIDIVLLPPPRDESAEPDGPPRATTADLAELPARFEADLAALWGRVADGLEPPALGSHWAPGPVTGSVRREAAVGVEGVDAVLALQALAGAERTLTEAGWHVLVPAHGMPRVLAGAPDGAEVEVVYVEARGRYAVTCRSAPWTVGPDAVARLLRGPA